MATPLDINAFTQDELDYLQAHPERCEYCGHLDVFHEQRSVDSYCRVDACSCYVYDRIHAEMRGERKH